MDTWIIAKSFYTNNSKIKRKILKLWKKSRFYSMEKINKYNVKKNDLVRWHQSCFYWVINNWDTFLKRCAGTCFYQNTIWTVHCYKKNQFNAFLCVTYTTSISLVLVLILWILCIDEVRKIFLCAANIFFNVRNIFVMMIIFAIMDYSKSYSKESSL